MWYFGKDFPKLRVIIGIICCTFTLSAHSIEKTLSPTQQIVEFVQENLTRNFPNSSNIHHQIQVQPLNERLSPQFCTTNWQIHLPKSLSWRHFTVNVSCDIPKQRWRVPVKITQQQHVWLTTHAIRKDEFLSLENVKQGWITVSERQTPFTQQAQWQNAKAKRHLPKGQILHAQVVCLVCRNDDVQIRHQQGNLSLSVKGKALSNGVLDDVIRVQNVQSKQIIEGKITASGEVSTATVK